MTRWERDKLERNGRWMEETLQNMTRHQGFLYKKLKRLKKQKKDVRELKRKLKSVSKGVDEVHEKCCSIWNKVSEQERELRKVVSKRN